ncbi:MAG: fumarylacetoacetate hydrolase family protein [Betaproteobacteria bacterium]|nr:fumarylacetoacetate hydrolase family protein [Betaproteobacteria bacterium]MDH4292802.1 fumarylacetoacetate hydrolase family protein [Betaproteobacteria bacterium]MDH5342112.1 fumarylacetoacetate hydrolase family protein [Betaproteobacteria bacterium]
MRLVRYDRNGAHRLGAIDGDSVIDLLDATPTGADPKMLAALADMTRLIAAGDAGVEAVRVAVKSAPPSARTPLVQVKLLSPLLPSLILCSGENYWDHRDEKPEVTRKDPEFFLKTALGVIGPGDDIVRDERVTQKLDYETELLIVIGKAGRHIPAAKALDHVYGYTVMNDVTARDRQVTLRPDGSSVYNLGPGKNFDTCAPIGPAIVTADEVKDPQQLALKTYVNGELRQSNVTGKMIWTCAQLIEFFSTFVTLQPGVVISTGTPGGTAWGTDAELGGKKPMRKDVVTAKGYLQPGDEVVCEIEGVGRLVNRIVAAT